MKNRKNVDLLRNNFYRRKNEFNGFKDLTDERRQEIIQEVEHFKSTLPKEYFSPNLFVYIDVMSHLLSSICNKKYTFDEKIVFLIEAVDKNLIALKIHNETETVSITDIKRSNTIEERSTLMRKKDDEALKIETKIRKELDFYDRNLRIFEKYYSARVKNKTKFEEAPAKDFTSTLLENTSQLPLDKISLERYEEICEIAKWWIAQTNSEGNQKRASSNIISQNNLLKLNSRQEQIIFFILVVDPELKAYTIYEENGSWKNIKEEMKLTLGFFSKELIFLEEKYHKIFCPQKFISEFTPTKK